ncbi:MAG: DNA-binding domain-containing protein [Pseudomonadota bacterium]
MLPDEGHHHSAFAAAVLDPERAVPEGVARANGRDPLEAFNVYRNNVVVSLAEALKSAFPVTSQLLGEGLQRALMADFARAHPPSSPIMSAYGAEFPHYVADHPATKARPFLADIARLERLKLDSYHAADAPMLDGSVLGRVPPEALAVGRLVPHPAMYLLSSAFPIASIFDLEQAAIAGQDVDAARSQINMASGEHALITRPLFDVVVQPIALGAASFLRACGDGADFTGAVDAALEADPAFDLQQTLALALSSGSFSGFDPQLET